MDAESFDLQPCAECQKPERTMSHRHLGQRVKLVDKSRCH
jgi:hypothetical protein